MRRRDFIKLIGSTTAAWPLPVLAQQGERVRIVAILMGLAENDPETKARLGRFRTEIEKLGWSEGRNLRIDRASFSGDTVFSP
jgi:putative ABC transport system substrate-binding protein